MATAMVEAAIFQGLSWNPLADLRELFAYPFMVNALEAGTIVAVMGDVARARGVPVRALGFGFLLVLGLSVAETSQITGALLVFALLVTPAATAHQLTPRPGLGIALSVTLALAVTWLGLALAYFSIYPVGFYVTSLSFGLYLLVRVSRALASRRRTTGRLALEAA